MIFYKNHKQKELFDSWAFLSPKRREMLDRSWPGLFKKHLLKELPVSEMYPFFRSSFGRPTKELYTVLGALVLQQTHDLTDEETVDQLAFNIQWHYALNITEETDSAKYMCPKTLWSMRNIVVERGLEKVLFERATLKLAEVFKVNTDKQRLDSVHIKSNMRRLGRIGLFSQSIHTFLINLKRNHQEVFETIKPEVVERYLSEKALECFSRVKPSDSQKTLASVGNDLFDLVEQFKGDSEISRMHSFKMLERVLREQCNVSETEDGRRVEVKAAKEISSDALQNPSDPDAGYSGHKGQGYQAQIMETYTDTEDEEEKAQTLNLVTHVEVKPANESDAKALLPAIEAAQESGLGPEEVLADSLYGGDENCGKAKELGVEVVSPVIGERKKGKHYLADFELSDKGAVITCPEKHAPVMVKKKKNRHTAVFDSDECSRCRKRESCPVKAGKKYHCLHYTEKDLRIARRRAYEKTEAFKDRYRWRSGIEATMSEYDRRTGVKRLRVRRLKAVRFCATLKAIGINIFRAAAVLLALIRNPKPKKPGPACVNALIYYVKEQILSIFRWWKTIFFVPSHYEARLRP